MLGILGPAVKDHEGGVFHNLPHEETSKASALAFLSRWGHFWAQVLHVKTLKAQPVRFDPSTSVSTPYTPNFESTFPPARSRFTILMGETHFDFDMFIADPPCHRGGGGDVLRV